MPRFEELHPDQQAVLQLVLARGKDYGDIGRLLGVRPERVRDRVLDAVDGLAPEDVDGLDLDGRERITDFLLGQQDQVAADGTRRLLHRSAPARAWARTVSAQLQPLATGRALPAVDATDGRAARRRRGAASAAAPVDAGDGRGSATASAAAAALDSGPSSGPARDARGARAARSADVSTAARGDEGARLGSRGGAIAMLVGLVLVVVLVVLVATGVLGGGEEETATGPGPASTAEAASTAQQINFDPVGGTPARGVGFAQVVDDTPVLLFQGAGFPRTRTVENPTAARPNRFYAVWLDGGAAPRRLGFLDQVGADGKVDRLVIQLPRDVSQWRRAVITEESEQDPRTPGKPIVRADLAAVTGG